MPHRARRRRLISVGLVFGSGLVLQIAAGGASLMDASPARTVPFFLILNLLAAWSCSYGLMGYLPHIYRRQGRRVALFLWVISFFLPVLGPLGLGAGLVVPVRKPPKPRKASPLVTTEIPDLPYRPLIISSQPIYGAVGLVGVIRHATDAAARVKAVMATRQIADQYAVPILQVALRDPVDDVRLLAYALLDSKERAIYTRIRTETARLTDAPPAAHGGIHKRLAQEHWELVYLGLAQGDVRAHVLESGLRHAREAMTRLPRDAGLHLLLGRMLCARDDLDGGSAAYDQAEALGLPPQSLVSFRAEVAFRRRQWDRVRELLRLLPPESKRRMPMAAVVAYWGAE